jgi:hypothetical protein
MLLAVLCEVTSAKHAILYEVMSAKHAVLYEVTSAKHAGANRGKSADCRKRIVAALLYWLHSFPLASYSYQGYNQCCVRTWIQVLELVVLDSCIKNLIRSKNKKLDINFYLWMVDHGKIEGEPISTHLFLVEETFEGHPRSQCLKQV